jgi:hypothetical protein
MRGLRASFRTERALAARFHFSAFANWRCMTGNTRLIAQADRRERWAARALPMPAMRIPDDEKGGKNAHSGYIEPRINECQPRSHKRALPGCHRHFQ